MDDHSSAIRLILNQGRNGETYNIGGDNEWQNIQLVNVMCKRTAALQGKDKEYYKKLITFVTDRPGHDRRCAIDCSKLKEKLGLKQGTEFSAGLDRTIHWYAENREWVERIRSGEYRKWIEKNYGDR